jgi:hypothetical protein
MHGPYGIMATSAPLFFDINSRRFYQRISIRRTRDASEILPLSLYCWPVGTPIFIDNGSTQDFCFLQGSCGGAAGFIRLTMNITAVETRGLVPTLTYNIGQFGFSSFDWREAGKGNVNFGPKVSGGQVYIAVDMRSEKKPGLVHSLLWASMTDKWKVPLQSGSGLDKPIPRGQPPPPSEEIYQATTPVAIRGMLAVVGAVKMKGGDKKGEESDPNEAALFAFNTIDGSQKWVYKITKTGKIMPTPAMLEDCIVFATSRGRFYSVGNDGKERWKTTEEGRVRTVSRPYVAPSILDDVVLRGPAVDTNRTYAYFSGNDGRIYRVGVRSGIITASDPLGYYYDPEERTYRTFTIETPPSIGEGGTGNFLAVMMSTRTSVESNHDKATALAVMKIPAMSRVSTDITAFNSGLFLDPGNGCVTNGLFRWGAVVISGQMLPKFDYARNLAYSDTEHGPDNNWFTGNTGGVSISNGFVFAADQGGKVLALRSLYATVPVPGSISPPLPAPYVPPFALDPVQVYPNPFRPDKAFGGTAKFRNLPRGSRVELFTLAYERVRLLTESGFRADWDGKNESGQEVAAGIYHYVITIPDQPAIRGKLAVVRK